MWYDLIEVFAIYLILIATNNKFLFMLTKLQDLIKEPTLSDEKTWFNWSSAVAIYFWTAVVNFSNFEQQKYTIF